MFITILIFLGVLVTVVCIHELGHFFAAKKSGVQVDEFGFGFPPKIIGKKWGKTEYTINMIPLGGFVKIKGLVQEGEKKEEAQDSFATKSFLKKMAILSGGIVMNFILAIVLFSLTYMIGIDGSTEAAKRSAIITNESTLITQVQEKSPAAEASLEAGDEIIAINNTPIANTQAFKEYVQGKNEQTLSIQIRRDNTEQTLNVTPTLIGEGENQIVGIGVGINDIGNIRYSFFESIQAGISQTVNLSLNIFLFLFETIKNIFSPSASVDTDKLSGPVGLAVVIKNAAESGIASLLYMTAILSVNLAVFNLLPIPMLDGGRIAFTVVEKIRKKPIPRNIEIAIYNVGFFLLIGLVIFVTIKDIIKL